MTTWIALLRGINVGGHNRLKMGELRSDLEALGLQNVRTYIQSGNVVFESDVDAIDSTGPDVLSERIATSIEEKHGFRPRTLVLPADRLLEAMEANPFSEAQSEPKRLHLFFLAAEPVGADAGALEEAAADTERFLIGKRVFYLHTPDGFGRSKLAARVESLLGVPATARNWRTVVKLREMSTT